MATGTAGGGVYNPKGSGWKGEGSSPLPEATRNGTGERVPDHVEKNGQRTAL